MNKKRKGFTLVELLVVIAILAILATVSVVGYLSFTDKAKQSNDETLVTQLNTALQGDEVLNGKPKTMYDALKVVEEAGFLVENLTPSSAKKEFMWDQENNKFIIVSEETLGETTNSNYWIIVNDETLLTDLQDNYSVYLGNNYTDEDGIVNVANGFDAGNFEGINTINFTTAEEITVTIRTNGGTLNVKASNATVNHYGSATVVDITAVDMNSYHEYGEVSEYLILKSGRVVIEENVTIPQVIIECTDDMIAKLEVNSKAIVNSLNVSGTNITITNSGTIKEYTTSNEDITISGNQPDSSFEYDNYVFNTTEVEGGLEIIGVDGTVEGNLYIPSQINGVKVVGIGDMAFANKTGIDSIYIDNGIRYIGFASFADGFSVGNLTKVSLPDSLEIIGDSAFSGCSSLGDITLPESLISIGSEAFSGCSSLSDITLPESLVEIGHSVFYNCTSIESIVIPSQITEIGTNTFNGCASLKTVTLNDGLEVIGASAFKACSSLIEIVIPDSVNTIGNSAFYMCSKLETVSIGDGVEEVGSTSSYPLTFGNCVALRKVTFGKNVREINKAAFKGCDNLSTIEIDSENPYLSAKGNCIINVETKTILWGTKDADLTLTGATSIASQAFYECKGLTSITIPESIRTIGEEAFYGCIDLEVLVLNCNTIGNEANTSLGSQAFYGCTSLKEISVGQYVFELEFNYNGQSSYSSIFGNCTSLETLTVDSANEYLYSENNCIINKENKTLVLGCKTSVIPGDVTNIGSYAFYGKGLTSMNIPSSVTEIGIYAFANNNMNTVIIPETVGNIGMNAFANSNIVNLVFDPTTNFGIFAFSGNATLENIYLIGTEVEWNALSEKINSGQSVGNEGLTSSSINKYFYSETKPEEEGNYWHWADDNQPVVWEYSVV